MIYNSCNSFVDQWLGISTGVLFHSPYNGPAKFVARNGVVIPGRPGLVLVISFFKIDGKKFAEVSQLLYVSLVLGF